MELIRPGTHIDFMKYRKAAFTLSAALIVISIVALFVRGLNYGIDFTGGNEIQVAFSKTVKTDEVRSAIGPVGLADVVIQSIGEDGDNEFLIRTPAEGDAGDKTAQLIEGALNDTFGEETVDIRRVDVVGAAVSQDLKQKGFLALFYAGIGILVYIWWRFKFSYSLGAVLALVHDVIVTVGIFSITGREISLTVIAALLTIVGYSLNDTIVIFDRIRENIKKAAGSIDFPSLLDSSISQTLSRTLITSSTTFFVVLALFLFGGSVINNFAFAIMVGLVVGTYSSIFIASPLLLLFRREKN
ncbi:MAG: protein translocase subunit SecF [Deltaproteobacteria bacterium]|nr:protein translocase subunit SecF [Deltaproteobacteria bacterium]MDX9761193.1 protein translocase subunit SecF [Desulfomonilia bacterium]HPW68158.1 protein translocase subunit SecF [Deltaproteobacteria bacterium]